MAAPRGQRRSRLALERPLVAVARHCPRAESPRSDPVAYLAAYYQLNAGLARRTGPTSERHRRRAEGRGDVVRVRDVACVHVEGPATIARTEFASGCHQAVREL